MPKSDFEVLHDMLSRICTEGKGFDTRDASDDYHCGGYGGDPPSNAKFINIRTNGFVFDENGMLLDYWAEYD